MVKLKELGVIITGNTPKKSNQKNYISNDICFIKPSDISKCSKFNIIQSEYYISEYARKSARIVPPNCVLVTCIGIIGNVAINDVECAFNQQINAIIPDENKCLAEYLAFAIQSQKEKLQNIANAPVVPIINKKQFSNFQIPLYDLDRQRKIVNNLKNICIIIEQKKMQLSKLDELVKARFVEMFGDPIINSKGLRETEFVNVVMLQRGFDLPTKERSANGTIPVYGSNGVLDYHSLSRCENGIITGRSGTIGQVYYCKGEFWPLNTTLFSIKTYCNNIIYLTYLLKFFKLERFYNGTGVPTLNRNIVHKQKIIDVPIELQNEFAEFVEQVEKSKKGIQQSLEKLETLKKSLMQEYFG